MIGHGALLYRGLDEFVVRVGDVVRAGLLEGDRVLVVAAGTKLRELRSALGTDSAQVDLRDPGAIYHRQAEAKLRAKDSLQEQPGRRTRFVAEQDLSRRDGIAVRAYLRQEAATNAAFDDHPVSFVCPYDVSTVPDDLVEECLRTHGGVLDDAGGMVANSAYVDPATYLAGEPVAAVPAAVDPISCETVDDLVTARHLLHSEAARSGLDRDAGADLVVAVNEVLTNALVHGRPPARLFVYWEGPALVCHVHDRGRGLADPLAGYLPPPDGPTSGRGLWMARRLCDVVEVGTDRTGTHVRLIVLTG